MTNFEFNNPLFLFLLIPYCLALVFYIYKKIYKRNAVIALSSDSLIKKRSSFRSKTYPVLSLLRFLSILLLILALGRPGKSINYSSVKTLGIDIMVALDLSGSMQGEDFQPKNRLTVAKQVVKDFISKRANDRLGLVVFAGEAYLQCPLTIEHEMIISLVEELDFNTISIDGTAIGDALALSASRMMDSKAKSKIILLLTDGMNNKGSIDPETAAKACAEMGIKVYSVGIGKEGRVPYPNPGGFFGRKQYLMNHFDETTLRDISSKTKGKFYRAQSSGILWKNIKDIDKLEKSKVDLKIYHEFHDKFQFLLLAAVGLFFLEIILKSILYRKIP